uniref:Ig-like domain-containing protein n=1 Tax=Astyanax mexicanus TaxID=7994 RepID=A0A3B1IQU9_ASTMX
MTGSQQKLQFFILFICIAGGDEQVIKKMTLIFFLLLFDRVAGGQVLTGPKVVKQCSGQTIQVSCRYHSFYRDYVKYWCRGYSFYSCSTLIRTDKPTRADGALDIVDYKNEGYFTVRMKNAKPGDNGWYWCAIERISRHVSIAMQLFVTSEAEYCSVPEPTTQYSVRQTTTLPVTTIQTTTTPETTQTTRTSQATSSSTDWTDTKPEVTVKHVIIRIWSIMRWILFAALCFYLICFNLYFKLCGRRK